MSNTKILICDDQILIHETLTEYIKAEGFACLSAYDGQEALYIFDTQKPDFIILDLMMPKKNGLEVCREIRQKSNVPIIMLTAKGEEIDKILGLELGADDYIVKPFSPREVVARIKVVLRRVQQKNPGDTGVLEYGKLRVNINSYQISFNGTAIAATPKEVELLYKMCLQPNRVFTREQLLSSVWGYDYYGDTRVVDTQIKRLRQKLPNDENFGIRSVYGVGYKFEVTEGD